MLNKKTLFSPALLTGIFFTAVVIFSACNNSSESKSDADVKKEDSTVVKPPDTASTRPVKPPTNPATN